MSFFLPRYAHLITVSVPSDSPRLLSSAHATAPGGEEGSERARQRDTF